MEQSIEALAVARDGQFEAQRGEQDAGRLERRK